jgi:putative transposase
MNETEARYPVRRRIRLPRASYHDGHCFFITIGTHERYPWFSIHTALGEELVAILKRTVEERHARLFAWCVMPEHIHLLVQDPDVVELVRLLKGRATPFARQFDSQRRLWQRSFHDHGLRQEEDVQQVAMYIFENPVRQKLARSPPLHRWSGSYVWPDWRSFYE